MDSTDCGKKAFHSLFGFPRLEREEAVKERGLWLYFSQWVALSFTLGGSIFHIGWFYFADCRDGTKIPTGYTHVDSSGGV